MTQDGETNALVFLLLGLLRRQGLSALNEDFGIDILITETGHYATPNIWRAAITAALSAKYIYEPTTLRAGALHCEWRLELTPVGFEAAANLL